MADDELLHPFFCYNDPRLFSMDNIRNNLLEIIESFE